MSEQATAWAEGPWPIGATVATPGGPGVVMGYVGPPWVMVRLADGPEEIYRLDAIRVDR